MWRASELTCAGTGDGQKIQVPRSLSYPRITAQDGQELRDTQPPCTKRDIHLPKKKSPNSFWNQGLSSEGDGNRTRNHRIDSPVL